MTLPPNPRPTGSTFPSRRAWLGQCAAGYLATCGAAPKLWSAERGEVWQRFADSAQAAGETELSRWLEQWKLPQRDDLFVAILPVDSLPGPPSLTTAAGVTLWKAIEEERRQMAEAYFQEALQYARRGEGEEAYRLLWQAHRHDPAHRHVRRLLEIDALLKPGVKRRGTREIIELEWKARSYVEVATRHFRVYSTATPEATEALVLELEATLAAWRQWLVPLWTNPHALAQNIAAGRAPLVSTHAPMQIILLPDRQAYLQLLGPRVPGVEQSTGYYSPQAQRSFLYLSDDSDTLATRDHELTHQFLLEGSRLRGSATPGRENGFWCVEGIACYAESILRTETYLTLGGWEAPRLQTARYRWLQLGHRRELRELSHAGQKDLATMSDLAQWYTDACAYSHLLLDRKAQQEEALLDHIEAVYRFGQDARWPPDGVDAEALTKFLQVSDADLSRMQGAATLTQLCLGATNVSAEALRAMPPLPQLTWLDLAQLPVDSAVVAGVLSGSPRLRRLNLERTSIDEEVAAALIALRDLTELDLSSTRVGVKAVKAIARLPKLEIVWLTATQVDDAALEMLAGLPALRRLDVQLTQVSEAGRQRFSQRRPDVELNPLQVVAS